MGEYMKLLHTSDWHLGIYLHRASLIEEQRFMIDEIKRIALEEKVDVVMISGDIYDTAIARSEAINLYDYAMNELCLKHDIKVIIIAGNHDSASRLMMNANLLAQSGLYISGTLQETIKPIIIDTCEFYALPFLHQEQAERIYKQSFHDENEMMEYICDDIKAHWDPQKHHILLSHSFVMNAQICDSDRAVMVGGSTPIGKQAFKDFDYVALGHLHRPQNITSSIVYSGSPYPYSFSEEHQEKQVMIIDTDTMEIRARKLTNMRSLRTLKGTYDEVSAIAREDHMRDDYMRIELSDTSINYEILQYFREYYPRLLVLTSENTIKENGISSLEISDIETLDEISILKQYVLDYYERELGEDELTWFEEAKQSLEDEVCI